ncbi:MAG: VWA domain-containing protein [Treponema sp.]|nr:VWA domain-containing protein [Treponema sp.]
MNISFEYPFLAAAAFIVIPAVVFIYSRLKNPFVLLMPLGAPGGVPFKTSQVNGLVKFLKLLEIISVFLIFLSAAGPSIRTSETLWLNRGADIMFIMDISPSMAALDMDGQSRFAVGVNLIKEFAQRRPADNIGFVGVGLDAALFIPLTTDREALRLRLELLRIGELGDATALGVGLAVTSFHLENSNAQRRVAIIVTDGENNAGAIHPETAAGFLRDAGVSFWVIAIGSQGEVPIDFTDPFTNIRRIGILYSEYDEESLQSLAEAGGGTLLIAPNADAFAAAFAQIDADEITIQRSRVVNRHRSIFYQFFIPAIFLMGLVKFTRKYLLKAVI